MWREKKIVVVSCLCIQTVKSVIERHGVPSLCAALCVFGQSVSTAAHWIRGCTLSALQRCAV